MSIRHPVILDGRPLNVVEGDLELRVIDVEGWHDSAPTELPGTARMSGVGSFDEDGRVLAKPVVVVGQLLARDRALVATEIEGLAALAPIGSVILERVDRTLGSRRMRVQRQGAVTPIWKGGPVADFRIPLFAADPRKYGETSTATTGFQTDPDGAGLGFDLFSPDGYLDFGTIPTSDGTVSITNAGTADAYPVFTIAGPTPPGGFRIVDVGNGDQLTFLGDVPEGSQLVLDARDGSADLNGVADRLGDLIVTRWPVIGRGQTSTFLFAPESAPTAALLSASVVATYW